MRVCAHINFGPYTNGHERFDSVDQAISYYPQCDQCDSAANYHDYPMSRYVVGPRGGLAKEVI